MKVSKSGHAIQRKLGVIGAIHTCVQDKAEETENAAPDNKPTVTLRPSKGPSERNGGVLKLRRTRGTRAEAHTLNE
ncbi:unnamed protein product [Somion occarium]|uniref:Uncharacterized protein n=1 Tax=Somion occarium TaxID=3059160 RepID=A0ABP1DVD3_9APHY